MRVAVFLPRGSLLFAALTFLLRFGPGAFAASPPVVSPTSLSFSSQIVNTTSKPQTITLRNRQAVALTVTSISTTGDFSQTSNCPLSPSSLARDTSCAIVVSFTPSAPGTRTGTLTVIDNAPNSPQSATLTGSGTLSGLSAITVTPAAASINTGTQLQFTATGTFSGGVTSNITNFVAWSSTSAGVAAVNSSGLASAGLSGVTAIKATSGAIVGSANLTVTAILQSIAVTPANPSIAKGQSQQFTATGTYSDGTTQNLTGAVNWNSSAAGVATVSGAGFAFGVGSGATTISAALGSVMGTTSLTVTPPSLLSITVTPSNSAIASGTTQQFNATGTYSDGTTQNLTATATWSSSSPGIAGTSASGLATGAALGTTMIAASSGSVTGTTLLTVGPPTLLSIAVTPGGPSITVGASQQLVATGTYTDGSTKNLTNAATWSSSSTTVGTVSSAGLANGAAVGVTTISAASSSVTGTTTLTVAAPTLVSLAVTPATPSVVVGQSQQFTATGTYNDGSTKDLTTSAAWNSSSPATATVLAAGTATTLATGSTTITATAAAGAVSGSAVLTVTAPSLVSIAITPANASLAPGATQQFTAIGSYNDGSTQDLTGTATWASSSAAAATVSATGLLTAGTAGSATISATSGSVTGSTVLVVTSGSLTSITVTPANASIALGASQQFTASASYSDGSTQDLTSTATWTSSAPSSATVSASGLAAATGAGNATITATSGAVSGSATIAVTPAALISIAVTPANPSIALGTNQQFAAVATYSDGSTLDITTSVAWDSSVISVATVNTTGPNIGQAASASIGQTTITATSGSVSGSTNLAVTPAALVSITVTPAIPSTPLGTTSQFTATGVYTDGTAQDITGTVNWTSSAPAIATISNAPVTNGLATSVSPGQTTITANSGAVTGSTTLTVTPAALSSIAVSPANASVALGTTQQMTATGTYTDGSTQDVTNSVAWSSSSTSVFNVNTAGLVASIGVGAATMTATLNSASASTTFSVTPATVVLIALSPATSSIALGTTQQFSATATFTDGTTQDVTASSYWTSSSGPVATVSNTPGSSGLVSSLSTGFTTITATSNSIAGNAGLTVTPAALVSLGVGPVNLTILLGAAQQFAASGTFTDGTIQDVTSIAGWNSSIPTVATITSAGRASSASVGQTMITVTAGQVSSSTTLSVSTTSPATEFLLTASSAPSAICIGPDGAVWFTEEGRNRIARITTSGVVTEFPVPTANAGLGAITTGPDGNLYFTEFTPNKVGRWNPTTQQFTEWTLPQASSGPGGILTGADGNLWIMESQSNQIERMTTTGSFLPVFNVPTAGGWPHGPTLASDGNIWFAELNANKVARITTAGQITEFVLPQASSSPDVMTSAADGVYFTEYNANKIARINLTTLVITQWAVPTAGSQPVGIITGADGNLYFTERLGNKIGILPLGGGSIVEYAIPTTSSVPDKITLGADRNLWFTEHSGNKIGRLY